MTGTLYLCATPIGNLEDMTFRVIRTLKEVDLIAAEDTRNSIKLLNHFEIQTPMTSYHEYNKYEKGRKLVEKLLEGQNIALITDAGTPGISDPGEELVKMCYESGISVTSLPGAAACITALTISGLSTRRFAFEAFLPSDKKEREQILKEMETETRTMIVYEAPHRLVKTLKLFLERLGNRKITICRELTKRHETALAVTLEVHAFYIPIAEFLFPFIFGTFVLPEQKISQIACTALSGKGISYFLHFNVCNASIFQLNNNIHNKQSIFFCNSGRIVWKYV